MATAMADPAQGDESSPTSPSLTSEQVSSRAENMVYKSGFLSLSSKGIGWTSWKKRWFILTRTSLVFFKNDPSAPPRGGEVNLTLGGIDLNNSGSVVVKEDKKLLTVLFPDGRDGRAFTLKAETLEDLYEWKTALEEALAQAPSATIVLGQNGIFKNEQIDVDGSCEPENDDQFVKPLVTGRPILLALEDTDGTPSFLEKALQFIEEYGVKVEGILRQAADVDEVEHRVREYEQGKTEFSPGEDPHVIGDCIKYVLRELPSSPVPASCCKALLEACRTDRGGRVSAIRDAICESFPEPNRRLLQRVLMMMQSVASHKAENRMSSSAVAACMAPLLLRPLLAGDCELENDFDVGGDGSVQLLQAAAAANHAQTIVITLLEEYSKIFGEGSISSDLYSDSDLSQSASEEDLTDDGDEEEDEYDEESFRGDELDNEESFDDNEQDKSTNDLDFEVDSEQASTGPCTESGDSEEHLRNEEGLESSKSSLDCTKVSDEYAIETAVSSSSLYKSSPRHTKSDISINERDCSIVEAADKHNELPACTPAKEILSSKLGAQSPLHVKKSTSISNGPSWNLRRPTVWSRIPVQKKLSMDSIEYALDDEVEIQRLEELKVDLKNRIAEETERNTVLQEALWMRKKALHDRRLALEQDVARLQEELQQERDLRATLEAGLKMAEGPLSISDTIDEKIKADLSEVMQTGEDVINLKKKFDELELQLNQQREQNHCTASEPRTEPQKSVNHRTKLWNKKKETQTSVPNPEKATKNKAYKNPLLEGSEDKNEKVEESKHSANKLQTLDQHSTSRSSNFKFPSFLTTPTSEPAGARPHASANSKKTWTKNEGVIPSNPTISTSSAPTSVFSRFTTRFNFLNERRTQIANEIQNMDKGRGSVQSTHNSDKNRHTTLECPYIPGPDKARSHNKPQTKSEIEGGSIKSPEKHRKSDGGQPIRTFEKHRKSDASSTHSLERGRSEGQHFWDSELGQGLEGQFPPRTKSR